MNSIIETIKNRRSVRTFDGRPLSAEHKQQLEEHIRTTDNPFGVTVDLRLLDAKEHDLSSSFILGACQYIAGKVMRKCWGWER